MVLHNNYYIDDTEKINFFRYENLENFDLASSITEKIQFNNDLLLKLESVDWTFPTVYTFPNETKFLKINNIEQKFETIKSIFLPYLIHCINIDKNSNYLENIELLYKSLKDVHYFGEQVYFFHISQKLKKFYENNVVEVDFINFMKSILHNSNVKELPLLINLYKRLDDILDSNSNNIFVVMVAKEKSMYKKYFYFFSKKNKLLLDKYDRLINIEEELYFLNNLIDKIPYYKENKILECIENKCLKYIDKLIKENNLLKGIHLLNYLLSFNGSTQSKEFKLFFHPTLMDKFINYYFKIFYELQEYEMIFHYYHLIENDIKTLQIVSDSYIQISKYDEALKILDKIEIMEPTLKYLQTTRNKINREQKINSFSNKNDKIDNMTGIEFEKLLTDKFNELNFIATQTKGSGDFGADIIVETSNQTKIIIQCKRFTSKVNLKAVQEVIGAVGHFEADIGIVITNNEFLNSAIKLAKSNDIELWDRAKLAKFLNNDISFSILNEV